MFPFSFTAAQVGSYFVGQYYQALQQNPEFVYQFYTDASTMLRIDANSREAASGLLVMDSEQIHTLIMSLNYTGIEIKTAHSLKSWNGGVLVMVTGTVHVKDFNGGQKFAQTFFLVPKDHCVLVVNDIFHFVDEEQSLHYPAAYIGQANLDAKPNTIATTRDQVSNNYMLGGEIHARNFVTPAKTEENGAVDNFNFAEEQPEQVIEDNFAVPSNGSIPCVDTVEDQFSAVAIEEPVAEPQKHTYASIVAKAQPLQAVPPQSSLNKSSAPPLEWQHAEPPGQTAYESSNVLERSGAEVAEEFLAAEDELEVKSVYVRNVPMTMEPFEIEEEFKKFGKIKQDGVAIRTRKDIDVCYAFVEFEDVTSVQNAIQAYSVQIGGNYLYIEGRRPNRNNFPRGRGRGRGRIGYQSEGRGGRNGGTGRGFGRVNGQEGERDYRSSTGNGFCRQVSRQGRAFSGNGQSFD